VKRIGGGLEGGDPEKEKVAGLESKHADAIFDRARVTDDPPFEVRPSAIQGLGAFATRRIPAEELAYAYAYLLPERHTPAAKKRFLCNCGSPRCRGTLLGRKG